MISLANQNDKFVAPKTKDAILYAEGLSHDVGKFDQDLVASQVPKRIIDAFESINVDDSQPTSLSRSSTPLGAAGYLVKPPSIKALEAKIEQAFKGYKTDFFDE
jgi:hypothetical protein